MQSVSGMKCVSTVIACVVLLRGGAMPLRAQGAGRIVRGNSAGTILDQAGKAIQGATVTVKNDTTRHQHAPRHRCKRALFGCWTARRDLYHRDHGYWFCQKYPRGRSGRRHRLRRHLHHAFRRLDVPVGHRPGVGIAGNRNRPFRQYAGRDFPQNGNQLPPSSRTSCPRSRTSPRS